MKKKILFAAMIALAIVGCSKNDEDDNEPAQEEPTAEQLATPSNVTLDPTSIEVGATDPVTLTWTGDENAASYRIYCDDEEFDTTAETSYSIDASEFEEGEYAFAVKALAGDSEDYTDSELSSTATLTVGDGGTNSNEPDEPGEDDTKTALDTPTATLSDTEIEAGTESVTLTWTTVENAASYTVYSVDGEAYTTLAENLSETTYTISTSELSEGTYSYAVQAIAATDSETYKDSGISDPVTLTVTAATDHRTALDAPTNLTVTGDGVTGSDGSYSAALGKTATLGWDTVTDADSYTVKCGESEYEVSTNSYEFTDLAEGEYTISVKANATAESTEYKDSDYSTEITLTVTDSRTALTTPSGLSFSGTDLSDNSIPAGNTVTLTWDSVSGADSYIVKCDDTEYEETSNSHELSDLNPGTYSISVKAVAATGSTDYKDSEYSDPETLTVTPVEGTWYVVTKAITWGEDIWKDLADVHGTSDAWEPTGTPEIYSDGYLAFYNGGGSGYKFGTSNSKNRIQLAGGGSTTKGCIQFKVNANGKVSVTAMSGSSGNTRYIEIYSGDTEITNDEDGVDEETTYSHDLTINGETTISICSKSSGINVFEISWTPAE